MKRYRKKTDLEIALSPVIEGGRRPTAKEMSRLIGGDPSDWGRILKGQQKLSGEYHARLKLLKNGVDNAQFELQVAEASKKYGERTRKGRIVPHTRNIFNDLNKFEDELETEKIIEDRMCGIRFENSYDEYLACRDIGMDLLNEEPRYSIPKDYFQERALRRDFLESLS